MTAALPKSSTSWTDSRPAEWTPDWYPPPRWGTRRRLERETLGPKYARTATRLGTPPFPAQQYVFDVAGEIDPETGLLAYGTVICILHRQFGKTMVIVFVVITTRGVVFQEQRMTYTAQDKNYAKIKMSDDLIDGVYARSRSLREGRDYHYRSANGSERLKYLKSGSRVIPAATQSSSGHGMTLDLAVVDEAWIHRTSDVDSGFRVPMITRRQVHPGPQQWIVSAAGNQHSKYLLDKRKLGRRAAEEDSGRGIAFFEWSCPDDWDIYDRSLWWFYIPALGHTITEQDVADEQQAMNESDWRRAYGSQFQTEDEDDPDGMDLDAWARQVDGNSEMAGSEMLAVDGSPDRRWASLAIVGERPDGDLHGELIKTAQSMGWLAEKTIDVGRRQSIKDVAVDPTSSAGSIIADLEAAGMKVHKVGSRAHAHAAGALYDRVIDRRFWHRGQAAMQKAVEASRKRALGDSWVWDRGDEEDGEDYNVTPLVAVTLGVGALLAATEVPPEDSVYDELGGFRDW